MYQIGRHRAHPRARRGEYSYPTPRIRRRPPAPGPEGRRPRIPPVEAPSLTPARPRTPGGGFGLNTGIGGHPAGGLCTEFPRSWDKQTDLGELQGPGSVSAPSADMGAGTP
jgi:hypothetical protein